MYQVLSPIKFKGRRIRDGQVDMPATTAAELIVSGHLGEVAGKATKSTPRGEGAAAEAKTTGAATGEQGVSTAPVAGATEVDAGSNDGSDNGAKVTKAPGKAPAKATAKAGARAKTTKAAKAGK